MSAALPSTIANDPELAELVGIAYRKQAEEKFDPDLLDQWNPSSVDWLPTRTRIRRSRMFCGSRIRT